MSSSGCDAFGGGVAARGGPGRNGPAGGMPVRCGPLPGSREHDDREQDNSGQHDPEQRDRDDREQRDRHQNGRDQDSLEQHDREQHDRASDGRGQENHRHSDVGLLVSTSDSSRLDNSALDDREPHQARVNWLGLQPVEGTQWMVLPMGAGLADGYLGVALFLAQLGRLTGVGRYARVARQAVTPVPALLSALDSRPDLLAMVGYGVAEGMAGISYALARMSTLLDDAALGEWAEAAVQLTARLRAGGQVTGGAATDGQAASGLVAGQTPVSAGWMDGLAGCLAAMTAVHAELGSPAAATVARACADQLADLVQRTGAWGTDALQPVSRGFAAGPAGIGWALARFGAIAADPGYQEAARQAIRCALDPAARDGEDDSPGWCRGTAGLLVARSYLGDSGPRDTGPGGTDRGDTGQSDIGLGDTGMYREARLLAQQPMLRDLSLCHGEAGITEALTMLAPAAPDSLAAWPSSGPPARGPGRWPPPWRHRAGLIADAVRWQGRFCGTPGGVSTPGLLRGLAGIGYALLRAGFTERVPSVLFLEPTPGSAHQATKITY